MKLKIKEIILSSQKDISQILTDIYNEHPYKVIMILIHITNIMKDGLMLVIK